MPGVVELVGVTYSEASGESCQNRAGSRKKMWKHRERRQASKYVREGSRRKEKEKSRKVNCNLKFFFSNNSPQHTPKKRVPNFMFQLPKIFQRLSSPLCNELLLRGLVAPPLAQ